MRKNARALSAMLAGLLLFATCATAAPVASDENKEWVSLFDGKTLNGWTPKINHQALGEDSKKLFSVDNGAIRVSYRGYESFKDELGHLFYKVPYSSYRIRLDYRFDDPDTPGAPPWARGNSGVMIHSQAPATLDRDQPYPISVEVQLLSGSAGDQRRTASLCTPGTRAMIYGNLTSEHCYNSLAPAFPRGTWVHLEIEVRGNGRITHFINGEAVMQYEQPQLDRTDLRTMQYRYASKSTTLALSEGYIALQAESAPIEFRNIAIKALP